MFNKQMFAERDAKSDGFQRVAAEVSKLRVTVEVDAASWVSVQHDLHDEEGSQTIVSTNGQHVVVCVDSRGKPMVGSPTQ
jgi:hypothetical protein